MLNEAKYRSPKWLRNFFDFEVNTGTDIKGDKTEKQKLKEKAAREAEKRKAAEAEERRIISEWDKRWRSTDDKLFEKFYCIVFKGESSNKNYYYLLSSEKSEIRAKWRGDMLLWEKFDKWVAQEKITAKKRKEEEERREREQERIKKELDDLWDKLVKDWNSAPYSDKIETVRNQYTNEIKLTYTFEDTDTIIMEDNKIHYGNSIYTVGLIFRNKFVGGFNKMIEIGKRRPSNQSGPSKRKKTHGKYADHPKGRLYQTLLDTIEQREENLKRMSKNDPEREAMLNELEAAKRQAQRMKDRYKFEHLSGFNQFEFIKGRD